MEAVNRQLLSLERNMPKIAYVVEFPFLTPFKEGDEGFRQLLEHHINRVISRIAYLVHIGENTETYELWDVLSMAVERLNKKEFYERAQALLPQQADSSMIKIEALQVAEKICAYLTEEKRYESVLKHSQPLRGRYRWSVIYIEHLVATYLGREAHPVDEAVIRKQSNLCQDAIKRGLKQRLDELSKSPNKEHFCMLEDLYWTALHADLWQKPQILQDEQSGELITQAFAVLKSMEGGTVKQQLAEYLSVRAVIEHMQEKPNDRQTQLLERLLFDNQGDDSSVGKASEYYLAWVKISLSPQYGF